jgi:hypothetical protein
MIIENKIRRNILSKAAALAISTTLLMASCSSDKGEARRAIGTGSGDYELTEGNDSTPSGSAVTGASEATKAAQPEVNANVSEKMDTSEAYSSVNGRTSTSNTGSSVSNGNTPGGSGGMNSGKQTNATPAEGSNQTATGQKVPTVKNADPQSVEETRNRGAESPSGQTQTEADRSAQPRTNRRQ